MQIKGHTTIELTDVESGAVETYEDNNMLTNALQVYLTPAGVAGNYPLNNDTVRSGKVWESLLGGLYLLDTVLEEDVENILAPAGVTMVGNGSFKISNSTEVTELGSYNETESGVQADGTVKMVWDFSTQQANGLIKCACLTSAAGGYVGLGNTSGYKIDGDSKHYINAYDEDEVSAIIPTDIYYPTYNSGTATGDIRADAYGYSAIDNTFCIVVPRTLYYNSSCEESHWSVTGKLVVNKYRYGVSNISIKDTPSAITELVDSYEITMPAEIVSFVTAKTGNFYGISSTDNNIYITFAPNYKAIATGSTFKVLKIDTAGAITVYTVTNNTGAPLAYNKTCMLDDEHIIVLDSDNNTIAYKILLTDSTQVEQITYAGGTAWLSSIDGKVMSMYNVWDSVRNKYMPINNYKESSNTQYWKPVAGNKLLMATMFTMSVSSIYYYYLRMNKRCDYLATINNLENPVTKTNAKTMKVTYTLTFEEEEI